MIHLGDITKISGYEIPSADCVTFGAPCQDTSLAGKRKGMKHTDKGDEETTRSGLFYEAIRVIKEMRDKDEKHGRTGEFIRPRFAVYENPPGAFSSNKGEDFRCVLESLAKIVDEDAVIPMPEKGKWTTSGCIMADGWSIAWRVLDAQFYGVPQRRRRIALIADFGGECASEILFIRKGLQRDSEESGKTRKRASENAEGCVGADDREVGGFDGYNGVLTGNVSSTLGVNCDRSTGRNGVIVRVDKKSYGVISIENHPADSRVNIDESGKVQTLTSRMGTGGGNVPMIMEAVGIDCYNRAVTGDKAKSLTSGATDSDHVPCVAIDRAAFNQGINANVIHGIDENGVAFTCVAKGPGAVAYEKPVICVQGNIADRGESVNCNGSGWSEDKAYTLNTVDKHVVVYNGEIITSPLNKSNPQIGDACHTLSTDSRNYVVYKNPQYIVRRLTPLECERLQGFPDGWTDIGEYIDSNGKKKQSSDSARYKALGNSIALPPWKWVLKRLCSHYERDATLLSLFDGIGGFPLIWECLNGKGTCLFASEIDEFPIAVTKARIG